MRRSVCVRLRSNMSITDHVHYVVRTCQLAVLFNVGVQNGGKVVRLDVLEHDVGWAEGIKGEYGLERGMSKFALTIMRPNCAYTLHTARVIPLISGVLRLGRVCIRAPCRAHSHIPSWVKTPLGLIAYGTYARRAARIRILAHAT